MPVVAFRFLKVDLFPTLSDQVCWSTEEYLNGWLLALGIMSFLEAQGRVNECVIGNTCRYTASHHSRWNGPHLNVVAL